MKYLLLIPSLLFCALFVLWPLYEMVHVSMLKTNYITTEYVGIRNYVAIFSDARFLQSLKNSAAYIAIMAPLTVGTALIVALSVSNLPKGWQDATRIIFYVPSLSAGIIIAQVWRWVVHPDGPLNWIVGLFGVDRVSWMAKWFTAIPLISIIVSMAGFGGSIVILLASILSIDKALFDSARIDGASSLQIKTRIIIPMIAPTIAAMLLLAAIGAPQIFETIYALAPYDHAATTGFVIYSEAFQMGRHGTAAAMSVILMLAMVGMAALKNKVAR